ncbi:hypothetical protein K8Z61_10445 [Nocardioides sp. TRM66260-LWL]|uniref:RCC1-like domain-containing protein n=1 Tax=Nocardioides sp. TRM66260-LWL TaxID=2874478 RepID=UPI001CC6D537|nr:hypothetical protein [Nocardioides sp. TRM66260-LWL]MBZ5734915.1 hypothetical protein [Nocardioides sp. TRM66260-LWL]
MPQPTSPSPDAAAVMGTGPSRRSVVTGAAAVWAAPTITVLASAPAFAASGQVQVTAFLPDATRPVSAYQRGTTQTFTATVTQGGSPVAAGTAVVFSLERLPGNTTATTDWLSLHPTNAAAIATTTTDSSGQATIAVRYLPGVVPPLPTTLRLTATTSTGSATLATWDLTYRPARPGTPDPHGAFAIATSSEASHNLIGRNGIGYAFGQGFSGQLGQGIAASGSPGTIATSNSLSGKTIATIAAGSSHSLALASDGTLHAWGSNSGQLGNGNFISRSIAVPVTIDGTSLASKTITAIATGTSHSLALASDGTLHAWGGNVTGQLGDGTTNPRATAVAVTTTGSSLAGKTIIAIAAFSDHSLALATDGTLHAWGKNNAGQLGDGTTTDRATAVAVKIAGTSLAGKTVTAIAAGDRHSVALASDGTLHTWGYNLYGQLGDTTTTDRSTAVAVKIAGTSLAGKTIAAISAGSDHSLVRASDNTLHAWGRNGNGQLGDTTTTNRSAAVGVATAGTSLAGKTITAIAAAGSHNLALATDGTIHAWGTNDSGQLGDGTTIQRTAAVAVTTAGTSMAGKTITAISANTRHSLALASDGTVHAWGGNGAGQLGDGTTIQRTAAVAVATAGASVAGKTITAIATGSTHSLSLTSDGTVHAWGGNGAGQLGDGTTIQRNIAIAVTTAGTSLDGKTITAIAAGTSHSLALATDGTLHAWGDNSLGQLGDGTTTNRATAVAVTTTGTSLAGKTITAIAAGTSHSLALATDGTIHAWGSNSAGQLGDGTTTNRATAVAVTTAGASLAGKTITAIAAGSLHTLALASDGTLHAWGNNGSGRLGDGTTTNWSAAVTVRTAGTSLAGKTITAIAAGNSHSLALASDGTVHAWGFNTSGQLGDSTRVAHGTAAQVTTGTSLAGKTIIAIAAGSSHNLALASDASLHAWGLNSDGQLGDGTPTRRTAPVLVNRLQS